jgi:hypothetical protein
MEPNRAQIRVEKCSAANVEPIETNALRMFANDPFETQFGIARWADKSKDCGIMELSQLEVHNVVEAAGNEVSCALERCSKERGGDTLMLEWGAIQEKILAVKEGHREIDGFLKTSGLKI